jgi:3-deoxy-D-manno-octulosonate 8-phosphate phosphatase (KDO 8-P phosphatase)
MGQRASADLTARCAPIELLAVDVDGVLTDGAIIVDDNGVESKNFHVRDGMAFSLWHRAGKRSAILSGRETRVVERRAAELRIGHVAQGLVEKGEAFRSLLQRFELEPRQVCFVGDDLVDLPLLHAAGLAACPADAIEEVRQAAHLVTVARGGRGAIREVVEVVLKAQGRWHMLCEGYQVPAM